MDNVILDNDDLKFRVVNATGKVLRESVSRNLAEMFVESLTEDEKAGISIVPVVGRTGDQVLFG